jgi:hypothetical protein
MGSGCTLTTSRFFSEGETLRRDMTFDLLEWVPDPMMAIE